jgi:hypothetical protein
LDHRPKAHPVKSFKGNRSSPGADGTALSLFVAGCFFISGAAGLVYEVIWVRLIDKVIGSALLAVAEGRRFR